MSSQRRRAAETFAATRQGGDLTGIRDLQTNEGPAAFAALDAAKINQLYRSLYEGDLQRFGQRGRAALLGASPELQRVSDYFNDRFAAPVAPGLMDAYRDQVRAAQAARGFGGGGTGPTGEEARFLLGASEAARERLAPQMAAFGSQLLGQIGLGGPQQVSANDVFQMHNAAKQTRTQASQARAQRTLGYIQAGTAILGGVTGAIGNIQQMGLNQQKYAANEQQLAFNRDVYLPYIQQQYSQYEPAEVPPSPNLSSAPAAGGVRTQNFSARGSLFYGNNPQAGAVGARPRIARGRVIGYDYA